MRRLTGMVLAGGKSRRFGSDKALAELSGETLLSRAVTTLAKQCAEILIIGRTDVEKIEFPGDVTVRAEVDLIADIGPVGGLLTGLSVTSSELNIVLAVDMPFASTALFDELLDSIGKTDAAVPVAGQRLQPLCAVYRKACLPALEQYIHGGGRSVHGLLDRINYREVEFNETEVFNDVDTRSQWLLAEKRLSGNGS